MFFNIARRLSCFRANCFVLCLLLFIPHSYGHASDAKVWLNKMSHSIKHLNYDISFVVIAENKANPWSWIHGFDDSQLPHKEYELITALNGPTHQVARKGDVLTYLGQKNKLKSIGNVLADSPLPEILRADFDKINPFYQFSIVGKSRVVGRKAQLIRIVAKDNLRHSNWLWLDTETALPLKMAIVDGEGRILEQIQVATFVLSSTLSPAISELAKVELPVTNSEQETRIEDGFAWQFTWLPEGFEARQAQKRSINTSGKPEVVDYLMLSDGLVWISVYVRALTKADFGLKPVAMYAGADSYLSAIVGDFEVTVIGKIPAFTAQKIAYSLKTRDTIATLPNTPQE